MADAETTSNPVSPNDADQTDKAKNIKSSTQNETLNSTTNSDTVPETNERTDASPSQSANQRVGGQSQVDSSGGVEAGEIEAETSKFIYLASTLQVLFVTVLNNPEKHIELVLLFSVSLMFGFLLLFLV